MATAKNKKISVPTMSTAALMVEVAGKFSEIPKKVTKEVLQSFLGSIEEHVATGAKVRLDKIGILLVKDRAARTGRNPQTGEEIKIPASKKVSFRVAASLKEALGIKKKSTTAKPYVLKKKK